MNIEIKFRKERITLGIIISLLLLIFSVYFIIKPEIFIRNVFMKILYIQILGIIGVVLFSALFFSILKLYFKKYALRINEEFIIDNSRYESLGKIEWQDILKIERIKKKSIEIFVNESVFQNRKLNLIKKFLMFMGNWNYKKSIIISNAFLDCGIEELYDNITKTHQNHKKTTHNSRL
ncbi:STM3941 family protein [Flavobacterium chuncheonense]|uniref:STM3941 family protein n=1 Tax=Flavobacterium chuncheonense TaxID=2026653 RepID=A0ABW5YNB9_9FLAO